MKFLLPLLILFISCAKEEFASRRNLDSVSVPLTFNSTIENCSNHTLIRPYVDFLFLWDNTSSQVFVSDETKTALRQTINLISDRFDYHILVSPLVEQANDPEFLVTRNTNGLTSDSLAIRIDSNDTGGALDSFKNANSSEEHGLQRAVDIISSNRSNGIFRKKFLRSSCFDV